MPGQRTETLKHRKPRPVVLFHLPWQGRPGQTPWAPSPGVMPGWEGAKDPSSPAEGSPAPPRGPTTTQDTWPGTAKDGKQPPPPASGTSCSEEMQPLRPAFLWLLLAEHKAVCAPGRRPALCAGSQAARGLLSPYLNLVEGAERPPRLLSQRKEGGGPSTQHRV